MTRCPACGKPVGQTTMFDRNGRSWHIDCVVKSPRDHFGDAAAVPMGHCGAQRRPVDSDSSA